MLSTYKQTASISCKLRAVCLVFAALMPLLCSCSKPITGYAHSDADQFICDSYQIRQGKLSILEMNGEEIAPLHPCALEEYRDTIVENDILNIALYHPSRPDLVHSIEQLNEAIGGFYVQHGSIQLPDLPPIAIAGLTLEEAKSKLTALLREQVGEIDLYLSYRDRLLRKVELNGLIEAPTVPVDGKIRLFEVLAKAKVAPHANLFMSYVMRQGQKLAIDLHKLLNEGDLSQNIVMRGGDKIFIASPLDASVVVMGEVRAPQVIALPYGFMSLREALVRAGGIAFTGDLNHIQVIRSNLVQPRCYTLCWNHVLHLPNDCLLLMAGDTVYISPKPITEWNRFIDQLLPSFSCFHNGYECYRMTQ